MGLSGVLDKDADDVLINVNLLDDERAAKNVENKKKKPGYQAYDDAEFDDYGTVCNYEPCTARWFYECTIFWRSSTKQKSVMDLLFQ